MPLSADPSAPCVVQTYNTNTSKAYPAKSSQTAATAEAGENKTSYEKLSRVNSSMQMGFFFFFLKNMPGLIKIDFEEQKPFKSILFTSN